MKQIKRGKLTELVEESLKGGWKMIKKIHSAGLFSEATYDERTVYSRNELNELIKEGFFLDQDAGITALNILLKT